MRDPAGEVVGVLQQGERGGTRVLGTAVGETLGYALTAVFTVMVVRALRRSVLPRWLGVVGRVAAGPIASGVLVPLVPVASLPTFAGYVLWCLWLPALAVVLFRAHPDRDSPVTPRVRRAAASGSSRQP